MNLPREHRSETLPARQGPLIDLNAKRIEPDREPKKIPWLTIAIALAVAAMESLRHSH